MVTNTHNHTSLSDSSRVTPTQAERTGAIRAGWNDAAWGHPQRAMPAWLASSYKLGYAGGLVFRRRLKMASRE